MLSRHYLEIDKILFRGCQRTMHSYIVCIHMLCFPVELDICRGTVYMFYILRLDAI